MKLFPFIFITAVMCQVDASTVFGRMTIKWPRRPTQAPEAATNPLSATPPQQQLNRSPSDCLLCKVRPCPTCLTARQYSPCVQPPCPPCTDTNNLRSTSAQTAQAPPLDDCTPWEIETATEELVHKTAAALPNVCLMRKSSLLPPFCLVDTACSFRGAGLFGFIRHHLREMVEYLRRHSFLTEEGFLDKDQDGNAIVVPFSSRSACRRQILALSAESSLELQNALEPLTTLPPESFSVSQLVMKILRR